VRAAAEPGNGRPNYTRAVPISGVGRWMINSGPFKPHLVD